METPIIREIFENAAETITVVVPPELRHRRLEVIVLPLDLVQEVQNSVAVERDANGWPVGFFESTFGSLPDFPDRAAQGDYEVREAIQ